MNTRSTDVKVGIAVILALVILVLGIAWIGEVRVNRRWATYVVYFGEVGGLNPGDPVTVSGLDMGKVGLITLESGRVRAELLVDDKVTLRKDGSVEVRSIGLMGEKYVYITPGVAGEVIAPGSTIEGEYKAGITDLSISVEDVLGEIKSLSQALRKLVSSEEGGYTLGESLARLNQLSTEMVTILRENRDDLRGTAKSMRSASENLSDILGGKKQDLTATVERMARVSARLDSLTLSLMSLSASIERGEGTLGMLIKERKLHDQIETTVKNLDDLIKDIKAHPERYVKIGIF
ncbi:MAG: MlaD family protein [Candidatus Eisenbacteria bacterium]